MKSLLDRLVPSMVEAVAAQEVLYPNTVAALRQALQSIYYVSDLRYGDALWLQNASGSLKFEDMWGMFGE